MKWNHSFLSTLFRRGHAPFHSDSASFEQTVWEHEDVGMYNDIQTLFPSGRISICYLSVRDVRVRENRECWQSYYNGIQAKVQSSQNALWDCATLGFSPLGHYRSAIFHRRLLSCSRSRAARSGAKQSDGASLPPQQRQTIRETESSVNSLWICSSLIYAINAAHRFA